MKASKFIEQQIAYILKQAEEGVSVEDTCRKFGSRSGPISAGATAPIVGTSPGLVRR